MTDKEKVLVDKINGYEEEVKRIQKCKDDVFIELKTLAPHKRGEIVKWTEESLALNNETGKYEWMPVKERVAVVTSVYPSIRRSMKDHELYVEYLYSCHYINKNGKLGNVEVAPPTTSKTFEWTGEIFGNFKKN